MFGSVNESTLFHLVPESDAALKTLSESQNAPFMSRSDSKLAYGKLGLEIGFHVPSPPSGRVITRLGRDTDLILCDRRVSKVHVAFEIHPETLVVLLSVRSKRLSSVTLDSGSEIQSFDGDYTIIYGQNYKINIASNQFSLIWRGIDSLKDLAAKEYQNSLQRLGNDDPRNLTTEFDSELHTWHNTRMRAAETVDFRGAERVSRILIGSGYFSSVYKTVNSQNDMPAAVKVINLDRYKTEAARERQRAYLYREVKALQTLQHENIIPFLGTAKWDDLRPEIFMPWRPATLRSLALDKDRSCSDDELCSEVLRQMLSALDYLESRELCHRDVKPENILCYYDTDQSQYCFQLCDFGLSREQSDAKTLCGTERFVAPELHLEYGSSQSPKMDIWSLFITIIDIHKKFTFPHYVNRLGDILKAARAAVALEPDLQPMAEEDPTKRASAAQMLVAYFGGEGLTTPKEKVPPISRASEKEGFLAKNQHELIRLRRTQDKASHKYLLPKPAANAQKLPRSSGPTGSYPQGVRKPRPSARHKPATKKRGD